MNTLVIASTISEIQPWLETKPQIDWLITGIGIPNTIFKLVQKLNTQKYDRLFQVGIAGTYDQSIDLGEALIVESDCFADLGVWENKAWNSIIDMGWQNPNEFPFDQGKLINTHVNALTYKKRAGATVQRLTDDLDEINQMQMYHKASVETMEGAAFHYVALQLGIPFCQIRGISNYVGERNKTKWKIKEAIESSCTLFQSVDKTFSIL